MDSLLEYRNTPRKDGFSPAQMMFGRRQRTKLPCTQEAYKPIDIEEAARSRKKQRMEVKNQYDKTAKTLPKLHIGQKVYVQDPVSKRWTSNATIKKIRKDDRSYVIEFENGKQSIRNRRQLRQKNESAADFQNNVDEENLKSKSALSAPRRSKRLKEKNNV